MNDYSDLERRVEELRQRRLKSPHGPNLVPYKAKVKRMAYKSFQRRDELELARHPGGNGAIGMIKMISHPETGCRLATAQEQRRLKNTTTNANTTTFKSGR